MTSAFSETRKMFINSTLYSEPLTYQQWMESPDCWKAALLFVQFYDQITLAWYKTKSFFAEEEDGVSTMMQYLIKNVPLIKANGSKFRESYIYQVAYNCLYCISHDIKREIERWEKETSNIVTYGDTELDLFDTVPFDALSDKARMREAMWAKIEKLDPETQKVINYLINNDSLKRTPARSKEFESDALRDVTVSVSQIDAYIEKLQTSFAQFKELLG